MSKVSLQYIGKKDTHEDADYGTGLWGKGAVRAVPREIAPFMLFHGDVWKDARPSAARKKDPITPTKRPPKPYAHEAKFREPTVVNILALDTRGCVNYAMREFGVRIDGDLKPEAARERVRQIMRERA